MDKGVVNACSLDDKFGTAHGATHCVLHGVVLIVTTSCDGICTFSKLSEVNKRCPESLVKAV